MQGVVLVLLAAVTVLSITDWPGLRPPVPSGSPPQRADALVGAPSPAPTRAAIQVQVGFAYPETLSHPPTADESQSKLWFNGGSWWGVLIEPTTRSLHLYRLEGDTQTWIDTGVLIDERRDTRADALWDGRHLYVATGGSQPILSLGARLTRYSFDPDSRTYSLDPGFPMQLTERGAQRLSITKDTRDVLWATYIIDGQIWVSHTAGDDASWAPAYPLPGDGRPTQTDVIATVAYGDSVGVFWASKPVGAIQFTSHVAGEPPDAWSTTTAVPGGQALADDHISARSLDGPDGPTVFAVVKTSFDLLPDSDSTEAQLLLLELRPDGEWRSHVYGRLQDHHTRPLLLIDEERRELYIFAVSPFGGGTVYYKRTSADEIILTHGKGAPFLQLPDRPEITSPTSTKQNVDSASGLLVLAADDDTNHYVHGALPLEPSP